MTLTRHGARRQSAGAPARAARSRAEDSFADRRLMARAGIALVLANLRYWTSVAPLVRAQLARWGRHVQAIPDPALQALAASKLREERLNVEVAATLATLAPRPRRGDAVEAIVALQVMYDYLDLLTEQPLRDPLRDGRRLHGALVDALAPDTQPPGEYYPHSSRARDGGYLQELVGAARLALWRLPAATAVAEVAQRAAARCAEAQVASHAAARSGTAELERWARREAAGTALRWPELLAGAAASVLAVHALIAAAADPGTTRADAEQIDAVYLSICALTMLDSLVDREHDAATGQVGYLQFYDSRDAMGLSLADLARETAGRARALPHAAHHVVTLAGVVAYYISAPAASGAFALPVTARLRRELAPLIAPTLALMRVWRLAKRASQRLRGIVATLLGVLATVALVTIGPAAAHGAAPPLHAHVAHTLTATDTAHLHYVSASGSLLYEEGRALGTLPGSMRVHLDLASTLSGSFTLYTRHGALRGHGEATPHGSGVYESFAGWLVVTGGTGRYAHARGRTGLYGTFDRSDYALTIQTTGTLAF